MAMGARQRDVLTLLMHHALRLIVVGVSLGLAGSILTRRALSSVLFGIGAQDALATGAVALFLATVALIATYLPARRASKASPLAALHYE